MAGVEVRNDNTGQWEADLAAGIAKGLETIGLMAEGYAKALCPVDTGRLRNSITHQRSGPSTEAIGTNVGYGRYVELGTSRAKAQPYLVPAATGHAAEYRAVMRRHLGA